MMQVVQLVGAILLLSGFIAAQAGRTSNVSLAYLSLNAIGSGSLAVIAALGRDWGFLLLEGTWAIVSLRG